MKRLTRPPKPDTARVREQLHTMSGEECAYCGKKLQEGWHKDHYLPQEHFDHLKDCWLNFLPSCPACNRRKWDYVPPALKNKIIVEPHVATSMPHDYVLDEIYAPHKAASERIIDPSFDNPDEHLEFVPLAFDYLPKDGSKIGTITHVKFFKQNKVFAKDLKKILEYIKFVLRLDISSTEKKTLLLLHLTASGYSIVGVMLYEYWSGFPPEIIEEL
jgi:hypothetical protein